MGIIWITHDLGLVAGIADRVMVMYAGHVVEHGPVGGALRATRSTPTPGRCSARCRAWRAAGAAAAHHRGPAAGADRGAGLLPVRAALRARLQPLPGREPAAHPGRRRRTTSPAGGIRRPRSRAMSPERARRCCGSSGLKMHFPIYAGRAAAPGRRDQGGRRRQLRDPPRARRSGSSASRAAASRPPGGRSCGSTSRPTGRSSSRAATSPGSRARRCGRCGRRCR